MTAPVLETEFERETRIASRLLSRYAAVLDDGDIAAWPDFFTETGTYALTTYENVNDKGMSLFVDRGQEALKERAAYALGYWNVPRHKTRRVVSNILVLTVDDDSITCRSNVVLYRVNRQGEVSLHTTGEYRDVIVAGPDGPRLQMHQVVLDANTLPADMSPLL